VDGRIRTSDTRSRRRADRGERRSKPANARGRPPVHDRPTRTSSLGCRKTAGVVGPPLPEGIVRAPGPGRSAGWRGPETSRRPAGTSIAATADTPGLLVEARPSTSTGSPCRLLYRGRCGGSTWRSSRAITSAPEGTRSTHQVGRDRRDGSRGRFDPDSPAKRGRTSRSRSCPRARLHGSCCETGRTHQDRVHLAAIGLPRVAVTPVTVRPGPATARAAVPPRARLAFRSHGDASGGSMCAPSCPEDLPPPHTPGAL